MQVKTISRIIEGKLEAWIQTIQDKQLQVLVRENLLVSGGSIASMLLNEEVNDYDVYFMNKETVSLLSEYYTVGLKDRIEVLTTDKVIDCYGRVNSLSIAQESLKENQVKLFFIEDGDKGGIRTEYQEEGKGEYQAVFFSPNAISLSDQIQIVTRFIGKIEEIHTTFDFIHATNYFTFETGLVTNEEALESLLTKQLRYQGSLYPLTSIIRFKKFVKRGWNISAGEILKIMFQIAEFDLKDPQVLEDQLIGVDVAYFSTLIKILRGTSREIDSPYLNTVIDKVFNSSNSDI